MSLKKLYLIFIIVTVIVASIGQYVLHQSLSTLEDYTNKINLVSMQRMRAIELVKMVKETAGTAQKSDLFKTERQKWEGAQKALTSGSNLYKVSNRLNEEELSALNEASGDYIKLYDRLAELSPEQETAAMEELASAYNKSMSRLQATLVTEKDKLFARQRLKAWGTGFLTIALVLGALAITVRPSFRKWDTQLNESRSEIKQLQQARSAGQSQLRIWGEELRTPVAVLQSMTRELKQNTGEKEKMSKLKIMETLTSGLLETLGEIGVEKSPGASTVVFEDFNPGLLAENLTDPLKSLFGVNKNKLIVETDPQLPSHMQQDESRIVQTIMHTGSYLNRHTKEGEISLCILLNKSEYGFAELKISMEAKPCSLKAELLETHFNAAQYSADSPRLSPTMLHAFNLVEAMGGRIWSESKTGGSVSVHFTIAGEMATNSVQQKTRALEGYKALVIENNKTRLKALVRQLSAWGVLATPFNSADLAAEVLSSLHRFDFCLLDIEAPEVNALELARAIAGQVADKPLPVIAMTSTDSVQSEHLSFSFSAVVNKPVKQSRLIEAIIQALGLSDEEIARRAIRRGNTASAPHTGLRVLVAQDNPLQRAVTRKTLELLGCDYEHLSKGEHILPRLQRSEFDLVFIDTNLPHLDTKQTTKQIKTALGTRKSPVIIGLAATQEKDVKAYLNAGMDDCIHYPLQPDKIEEKIDQWFEEEEESN